MALSTRLRGLVLLAEGGLVLFSCALWSVLGVGYVLVVGQDDRATTWYEEWTKLASEGLRRKGAGFRMVLLGRRR